MSKKALIICAAGMSSSMMAAKATDLLKNKGLDILVEARGVSEGEGLIKDKAYDLYLISPQTKMYFKQLENTAKSVGKDIVQIPPQAYIPIPSGIAKMADLVAENLAD